VPLSLRVREGAWAVSVCGGVTATAGPHQLCARVLQLLLQLLHLRRMLCPLRLRCTPRRWNEGKTYGYLGQFYLYSH
jgi:hypothetical protein